MNSKFEIEDIEPFNDIFYESCYFNSLFPVLIHYNVDIMKILVQDNFIYSNENYIGIEVISEKTIFDKMQDVGIKVDRVLDCDDMIQEIINDINKGRPVIAWIDTYYESIVKENYLKNHDVHTILVYGYDQTEETFQIIEHTFLTNMSYDKRTISFTELRNCCNGFIENNKKKDFLNVFELDQEYEKSSSSKSVLLHTYLENTYHNREIIQERLDVVLRLKDQLQQIFGSITNESQGLDSTLESLNAIINGKRVELYIEKHLDYGQQVGCELLSNMIHLWECVRRYIGKMFYLGKVNENKVIKCMEMLSDIYGYEKQFLDYKLNYFVEPMSEWYMPKSNTRHE